MSSSETVVMISVITEGSKLKFVASEITVGLHVVSTS